MQWSSGWNLRFCIGSELLRFAQTGLKGCFSILSPSLSWSHVSCVPLSCPTSIEDTLSSSRSHSSMQNQRKCSLLWTLKSNGIPFVSPLCSRSETSLHSTSKAPTTTSRWLHVHRGRLLRWTNCLQLRGGGGWALRGAQWWARWHVHAVVLCNNFSVPCIYHVGYGDWNVSVFTVSQCTVLPRNDEMIRNVGKVRSPSASLHLLCRS